VLPDIRRSRFDWIGTYGRVAATGQAARFEEYWESIGKWVDVSAYCPREGYFVTVFSDVSERMQAEEAVRRLNVELEHRVAERTAALESANRELESFCYSVSHDLRAPLRGMAGFSQALKEDYGDRLDDTACDYIDRICGATRRMGHLIDDLLKLSRVSRSEVNMESVDLTALGRDVGAQIAAENPGRDVVFTVQDGMTVRGDPRLLRVALENLVGNAWKFTRHQDTAHVEMGSMNENGGTVYYVRDDGAGFDSRYAGKLFRAFQRLHSAAEFEGTGIGLATVQRVMRRHGGRVWAEAAVDRGATFYFTLS
jgi:light-regulated signal transduction histidine kinase (bacteriophytochrome)